LAAARYNIQNDMPMTSTVVVAGIGCSGNFVHLLDGEQPYGFHGIHGRTLPIAFGVKMARPELNVLVVAGDGDFLSIGAEHIGPQAQRNLNVTALIMDNAVYGLTKGQSSPTTEMGGVTSSTPFGKTEMAVDPLRLYLSLGVSFVASGFSSKPRELADLINKAMNFPGFAIVHVQSPCPTYNDITEVLKGNVRKGIVPTAWDVSEDHNPADIQAAFALLQQEGVPLGVIYQKEESEPLEKRVQAVTAKARTQSVQQLVDALTI
jgi:2-oxoglutarate ferredoxin oxidoreductase subunit beta